MEYEDNSKKSRFNAGIAFTERIHSLQLAINSAKFNPLLKNPETGTYNYEIMIVSADCLVSEGWDKFTDEERKLTSKMNKIIRNLNEFYPPITIGRKGEARINKVNYKKLLAFFELYERKIKEIYGTHDLNSPSQDDEGGDYDY